MTDTPDAPSSIPGETKAFQFEADLARLVNRHSLEEMCGDTPDFVIAQYLTDCLWNLARATERREDWYGRGKGEVPTAPNRPPNPPAVFNPQRG